MTRLLPAAREQGATTAANVLSAQIAALDWAGIAAQLDSYGCATTGRLLTLEQCTSLAESYASDALFRSRVVMARHGFGRGEYKYFDYPLPELVAALRAALYPPLADIANHARHLSGQHAPWREPPAIRPPPHAGGHFPRRPMS